MCCVTDPNANRSYSEMVRRQTAEDVARWMRRLRAPDGVVSSDGGWAVWQLVGVFADRQDAVHACDQPGRFAVPVNCQSDPRAAD